MAEIDTYDEYWLNKNNEEFFKISKSLSDWYVLHGYEVVNLFVTYTQEEVRYHIICEIPRHSLSDEERESIANTFIDCFDNDEE